MKPTTPHSGIPPSRSGGPIPGRLARKRSGMGGAMSGHAVMRGHLQGGPMYEEKLLPAGADPLRFIDVGFEPRDPVFDAEEPVFRREESPLRRWRRTSRRTAAPARFVNRVVME